MLRPASEGVAIIVCNTCRLSRLHGEDVAGQSGGMLLADALRAAQAADARYRQIAVEEMACLFACTEFCTIHLRGPGRISYVLGRFAPDAAAARAILNYALAYAASNDGEVPFADWPEGVHGHFITRAPPPGFVCA